MGTAGSAAARDPLLQFQEQVVKLQNEGKDLSKYEVEKTRSGVFYLSEIPENPSLIRNLLRGSATDHIQNIRVIAKKSQELLNTPESGVDSLVMTRALNTLLKKQVTLQKNPHEDTTISDTFAQVSSLNRKATEVNPTHRAITSLEQAIADLKSNSQPLARVMKQIQNVFTKFRPSELDRLYSLPEFRRLKSELLMHVQNRVEHPNPTLEKSSVAIQHTSLPAPRQVEALSFDSSDSQYKKTKQLMDKWFSKIPNFDAVQQTFAREKLENFSIGRSLTPELRVLRHLSQEGATQNFLGQAKIALLAEALSEEMRLRWPSADRAAIDREVANLISLCPIDKNPISDLPTVFNKAGSCFGIMGEGAVMRPALSTEQPTPRFIFRFHEEDQPGCSLDIRWKFKIVPDMLEPDTSYPVLMRSSLSKSLNETVYRGSVSMEEQPPPRDKTTESGATMSHQSDE